MREEILKLSEDAKNVISNVKTQQELLNAKALYLGKEGKLTNIMKRIKDLSIEEKKIIGVLINNIKNELEDLIKIKLDDFYKLTSKSTVFDNTLPIDKNLGTLSPITIVAKEVTDILVKMGFVVVSGPEKEFDYYNFQALNIPKTHPARDMQDTYWLDNGQLLRTHTSPCQVRAMEKYGAPLRIVAPGRCFRNEDIDACHENTFFQIEGMVIDKEISINNLLYVMKTLLSEIFNQEVDVRLRPGFFPFVEPGFELDVKCLICGGIGCPTCKGGGWVELMPCGMVHPEVLRMSKIDPDIYSGFAFGLGLTRLAMMKYKIKDIRVLNSGDIRSLKQFDVE